MDNSSGNLQPMVKVQEKLRIYPLMTTNKHNWALSAERLTTFDSYY